MAKAALDIEAGWRLFLEACPGFLSSPEGQSVDDDDGRYIWMAALARYLVGRLEAGDTSEVAAAFGVAEVALEQGERDARNFVNVGFIEDVTNGNLFVQLRPEALLPFCGPLARHNEWIMNLEHGF